MEEPRLSINVRAALPTAAVTPRFLEPLAPPTYPFTSPAWSLPQKPRAIALLDVIKDHELLTTYTVDQKPVYLIGRNAVVCDIVLNHCSVSRLHATIIHHRDGAAYLVDMGSCHGTFLDDMRLRPLLPTLITHGSVLKFGASSRSYTFKSFETREQILERVQSRIGLDPHEMEVEQNTLMNRALSYRLGFSIPLTHKATDAEGDALMQPAFPVRQMEASTSAASLIRRTHSEDNTLAGVFPVGPVAPQNVGSGILVGEPGRKRSRTQSAGLPTTTSQTQSSLQQPQLDGDNDEDDGLPKRVHFSEHPVETIPPHPAYFSPEQSPLLSGVSLPSSASSSPQIVPESHLPPPPAAKATGGPHGHEQPKRPLSPPPPLRLAESPEHDTVAGTS